MAYSPDPDHPQGVPLDVGACILWALAFGAVITWAPAALRLALHLFGA